MGIESRLKENEWTDIKRKNTLFKLFNKHYYKQKNKILQV